MVWKVRLKKASKARREAWAKQQAGRVLQRMVVSVLMRSRHRAAREEIIVKDLATTFKKNERADAPKIVKAVLEGMEKEGFVWKGDNTGKWVLLEKGKLLVDPPKTVEELKAYGTWQSSEQVAAVMRKVG